MCAHFDLYRTPLPVVVFGRYPLVWLVALPSFGDGEETESVGSDRPGKAEGATEVEFFVFVRMSPILRIGL